MKVLMIGHGAFAQKHMDGIVNIDGAEVVSIMGRREDATKAAAEARGIPHWSTDLDECLAQDVDCAIITSATQVHAEQAIKCLEAGKHVEVEIPMADTLADAQAIHAAQQKTGLIAMAGHTRRFNPSHQWVHNKITAGELNIQQMDVQTSFSAAPT